jgi:hypothetical protein
MRIDADDWDDWTAHPLTEALLRACATWAEDARNNWVAASWEAGNADPLLLARMRERAAVFNELRLISRETMEEVGS